MKKECVIFIIEPERIIGLELQLQFENNGYSVFQSHALAHKEILEATFAENLLIVDIDRERPETFEHVEKFLNRPKLSVICIGSDKQKIKETEYNGVHIIGAFLKPFDSKEIVTLVNQYYGIGEN